MVHTPKCFISYSWESQEHKDWVRFLAERLQENGIHTFLDQWDISLGDQLPCFMESSIRDADFILLVCTPTFASKANSGKGGVGYEKNIVTGEMFLDSITDKKFIAIIRKGSLNEALPSYLKSKVFLDFRDNEKFAENLEELLRHFYDSPRYVRPHLGQRPIFSKQTSVQTVSIPSIHKTKSQNNDFEIFTELFTFAKEKLGKTTLSAEDWAKEKNSYFSSHDFQLFKDLFAFAQKSLGKTTLSAKDWAEDKNDYFSSHDFQLFKDLFAFAQKSLGKTTLSAKDWAEQKMEFFEENDFSRFVELFHFSKSNLGKTTLSAEDWAFESIRTIHR